MEFNIGDHTALKLPEADTRREALDEATRDAPPGAGDGLGSQTEPDEEGMAENAVETMSLTEAPASSKRGSSATDIDYDPRRRAMSQAGWAKMAGQPWQASPARRESTWLPLVVGAQRNKDTATPDTADDTMNRRLIKREQRVLLWPWLGLPEDVPAGADRPLHAGRLLANLRICGQLSRSCGDRQDQRRGWC